ncbi:hypothetical protein ACFFX0_31295 [Citricoccus parietis]|uniref:Uncharacterized protein n=1 Tax=Citricoccus parietis TaxID=592307 RepID=A0ABV5G8Y8_9MICC
MPPRLPPAGGWPSPGLGLDGLGPRSRPLDPARPALWSGQLGSL